jgi:predicted amidohydrolase YtcJ
MPRSKLSLTWGIVVIGAAMSLAVMAQTPRSSTDAAGPADLVLRGGTVFTADDDHPFATAVAVRRGRIVYVGDEQGLDAFVDGATRTIDLGDGMLLPGFHDSHVHIVVGGLGLVSCDLSREETPEAVATRIATCAGGNPAAAWVTGGGWQLGVFSDAHPTREQLDAIVPDRPAFFMSADGHSGWANSRALAAAEITATSEDPAGGRILRDPETGNPTGTLRDAAAALVARRVPLPTDADLKAAIVRAIALANSFGITSVHEANAPELMLPAYKALDEEGILNARVTVAAAILPTVVTDSNAIPGETVRIARIIREYRGARLKVTAVKIGADGVLETRTAALLEPYVGSNEFGATRLPPEIFQELVVALDRAGIQVHVHSIGDRAARMSLDAIEAGRMANGMDGPVHQIAHLQLVHPADIPRFRALRVAANIQGLWAFRDSELQHWSSLLSAQNAPTDCIRSVALHERVRCWSAVATGRSRR